MAKKQVFQIQANYKRSGGKCLFRVERQEYATTLVGKTPLNRYSVLPHPGDPTWSHRTRGKKLLVAEEDGNGYRISRPGNPSENFYLDYGAAEDLLLVLKLNYEVDRGNEFTFYSSGKKRIKRRK